jgi:hypothetical protein
MELEIVRRNGDRHVVLFDSEDAALISEHTWCVTVSTGKRLYAATSARNDAGRHTLIRMHRLLMGVPNVDHINGNGLDNRRANLRESTQAQNLANSGARDGTSRFKGVSWLATRKRWQAHIMVAGKSRGLGAFDLETDAALAYDMAAITAWGDYARLNFPERLTDATHH